MFSNHGFKDWVIKKLMDHYQCTERQAYFKMDELTAFALSCAVLEFLEEQSK